MCVAVALAAAAPALVAGPPDAPAKRSPVLSKVPVLSDGTLVTAQVATSNNGGKEFYEAMGMETEGGVVNDLYRLLSPDHRDAFVLVGRVH